MALFGKIFGGNDKTPPNTDSVKPTKRFGRFSDCNKSKEQLDSWAKTTAAFKEKNYPETWKTFFDYICEPALQNVKYSQSFDKTEFEIIQGSKIVRGTADNRNVMASVDLVKFDKPSVPVMRKMLALNYNLRYSSICIHENRLAIKFSSPAENASPTKLYWGLKEIATTADKQDDLLAQEFSSIHMVDDQHIEHLPENEKEVLYKYFCIWIDDTFKKISALDEDKMAGAISFYMLDLALKLDYLLVPEGRVTEALERIMHIYFNTNGSSFERNNIIRPEFEKLRNLPKEEVTGSFYKTKATFGVPKAIDYKTVADFIFDESKKTDWYYKEKMFDVVTAIYEYMTGYSLFYWGMYAPIQELFEFYMHLLNNEFYKELGYSQNFIDGNGVLNKEAITKEIRDIISRGKGEYPNLNFATEKLNFNNLADFSFTFFQEFDFFNFSK